MGVTFHADDCGHDYSVRITLPYSLIGKPGDETVWAALADHLAGATSLGTCLDCIAIAERDRVRERMRMLASMCGCSPLAELDGTPRLVAYAESVRWEALAGRFAPAATAVETAVSYPTFAERMLQDAFRAQWPDGFSGMLGEDIDLLAMEMNGFRRGWGTQPGALLIGGLGAPHLLSHRAALAIWLVWRDSWPDGYDPLRLMSARAWIASSLHRGRYGTVSGPATSIVNAAVLIADIGGWETRWEAYGAFRTLLSRDQRAAETAFRYAREHADDRWRDLLADIQVMDALACQGPAPF